MSRTEKPSVVESPSVSHGATTPGPIVFYDGNCGLCDHFVQFVLKQDSQKIFRFAPLQGETFRIYERQLGPGAKNTVVLVDERGVHVRSEAALLVLSGLGYPWVVAGRVGQWVPRWLRDGIYRLVAHWRYRIFGKAAACRLPGTDPSRFLP